MTDTPSIALTYLEPSQTQKHVTVNNGFRTLDTLVQPSVKDKDLAAPPGSPANGDAYIVAAGASGLWAGQSGKVAAWYDTSWFFYAPKAGWRFYVADENVEYVYTGSAWAIYSGVGGGGSLTVNDEGTNLTTSATSINFVGAGVTATNTGGAVTVTIAGGGGSGTFLDNAFTLQDDADNTKQLVFELSGITAATTRTLTVPNASGTLALLSGTQTFSGNTTFSGTLTASNATVTLGTAVTATTVGLGTGAVTSGVSKAVNIGTAGLSGSTTTVEIGSSVGGALGATNIRTPTVFLGGTVLNGPAIVGTISQLGLGGATPDATNRLSINTPAVLLNNAGTSIDMTFNKNAAGNDASLSFKTGFSTRAIAGLTGSDDFTLKVSPDGSSFFDGFSVSRTNGVMTLGASMLLPAIASPVNPGAGKVNLFGRSVAGRIMPAFMGPSGLDSTLQPNLARNKVGYWAPSGNAATLPGVFGFTAPTTTGFTATARNVATTNLFTRMRRLGFVTAATAGTVGQFRVAMSQFTIGNGSGLGGFHYITRFGISDPATVADARMFMGLGVGATVPTNVEPSTLVNCVGIGHGAADANLKLFYGGSAAQTPIDLGANFPKNTLSVDIYELALFASPNSQNIQYEVTRLNTGHVATGTLSGTVGTQIPAATTLLAPWGYRTNNASALAVGIDVASCYIETDQ